MGTATGYPATRQPYSGAAYPASATSFNRPGYTPNFPNKGYPLDGARPFAFSYGRPRYGLTPLYGGLGLVAGLQLYYWLGLGHYLSSPYYYGTPYYYNGARYNSSTEFVTNVLDPLPNAELALLLGNGTQSCQKVILWRYEVASLVNAEQIRVYFDCIDKDGDNVIDPFEFCVEYGCYGDPGNRFANFDAAMQTIDLIDHNEDGVISPGEFDPKLQESSVISQSG